MNASVQHASRHAMNRRSCLAVATSARYAFTMGLAPAKAPDAHAQRQKRPEAPAVGHAPRLRDEPAPTPSSESARMGLRPTLSLRRGHAKSAKNMPRGYALVRYPTCEGCSAKCRTRLGVMGPVTVNPSRCRNTASITHATLACLRHVGSEAGIELSAEPSAVAAGTTESPDGVPAARETGRLVFSDERPSREQAAEPTRGRKTSPLVARHAPRAWHRRPDSRRARSR